MIGIFIYELEEMQLIARRGTRKIITYIKLKHLVEKKTYFHLIF